MEDSLLPKTMPKKIMTVWRLNYLMWLIGLLTLCAASFVASMSYWSDVQWLKWTSSALLVMIGVFFLVQFKLIPYRYKFHRFSITDEDIAIQDGYLIRNMTFVPMNRIQHVETKQGPFMRKYGLMEIHIHTAATTHVIAGLDVNDAEKLRRQIIELVKVAKVDV
ncbi:PH domain-containing protein [Pediococcus siamensis]|uniref:PH domain-containing protein n=1 Tax=Pediococcus siamensis TaxID=381829 RepID=UPI0039A0F6EE